MIYSHPTTDWEKNIVVVRESPPDAVTFIVVAIIAGCWSAACVAGMVSARPSSPTYSRDIVNYACSVAVFGSIAVWAIANCTPSDLTIDLTRGIYVLRRGFWFGWTEQKGPLSDIALLYVERMMGRGAPEWRRYVELGVKRPRYYSGRFANRAEAIDSWSHLAARIGAPFETR